MKNDKLPRLIVGHVGPDRANIWGRGDAQHPVMFVESGEKTVILPLSPKDGYAGSVVVDNLKADTRYEVRVSYGADTETPRSERVLQRSGQFETTPPPSESRPFSMLLNSCNHHGWGPFRNNDKANERRTEVARGVDMVLHTGDQVYADKAPISFSLDEFRRAYEKAWSDDGVGELLAGQANYMIPDDHEVVNGYVEGGKLTRFQRLLLWLRGHGKPERPQYEEMAQNGMKSFGEFQRSHGPTTHGSDVNYFTFEHGRHKFFALDTGLNRQPRDGRMISTEQQQALFSWLKENRDNPKFILTSTPFVMEYKNPEDKWNSPHWVRQRDEIIDFLAREKLHNVVFLAGDVHASGHARLTIAGDDGQSFVVDELTSSPVNGSIMRDRDKFVGARSGVTESGTSYRIELDEESFLGRGSAWNGITNSNVMKVEVDGDRVGYSIYRTRHGKEDPVRQGEFLISD